MKLDEFKLIVIDIDHFTDEVVFMSFLDLRIRDEDDIRESVNCLRRHRPRVFQRLERLASRLAPLAAKKEQVPADQPQRHAWRLIGEADHPGGEKIWQCKRCGETAVFAGPDMPPAGPCPGKKS